MNDEDLERLGNYFVKNQLHEDGWEFHEFVSEWQAGYIQFEIKG